MSQCPGERLHIITVANQVLVGVVSDAMSLIFQDGTPRNICGSLILWVSNQSGQTPSGSQTLMGPTFNLFGYMDR